MKVNFKTHKGSAPWTPNKNPQFYMVFKGLGFDNYRKFFLHQMLNVNKISECTSYRVSVKQICWQKNCYPIKLILKRSLMVFYMHAFRQLSIQW